MLRKNVASQVVGAQMVSASDGSAFTGAVTVSVTGDGGTQATGSVGSGACTHEGNGFHTYAPAQAETNYNHVAFTFTGTGAVPATVQVYTASFNPTDTVRLGLTALPNAAADGAGGLPISDAGGLDLDAQIGTDIDNLITRLGTPSNLGGGATVAVNLSDIEAQTDDIGVAGAGLTAVGDTAGTTTLLTRLSATRAGYLDNLSAGAVATAAKLLSYFQSALRSDVTVDADIGGTYDDATDSQQAIRDRGDSAWATATGFATSSALSTLAGVFAGITSLAQWLGAMAGKQTPNSTALTEINATGAGSGTFTGATDSIEAIRDRGDAAWTTATGFSTLDAAGVRTAVGLASANLDTQLDALPTAAENATATTTAIGTGTALTAIPWNASWDAEVQSEVQDALDAILADSVPSDGTRPSLGQGVYAIYQFLTERSVSGTTLTVRKPDGSTALMSFTLNDASSPTSITRAS